MATLKVVHPTTGKASRVQVPDDHNGSRVKVEFPDGAIAYTEGFDPAGRELGSPAASDVKLQTDRETAASGEGS